MSGGGFRGRGFGSHGPRFNNPGSGGRNDGPRNGSRHRGNYSRGNYNNPQHPSSSFSSQSGPSRRNDQQQENWSQNRSFSRWEQPHGSQGINQPPNWSHNRGEPFQNSSVRFPYHNNAPYQSRSGRGHFRNSSSGGSGFRFTEHRGSNNYYNPPYYNSPYKENTFHQQEQNIIPDEPVTPLLGSEEERQQKITEAADELKRKLLTNRAPPQEESNWYEDFNIDSMTAADKEANTIKGIPELKHGPPELNLTLSDLKDIGRVDIDSTIDPSATEPNLITKTYDESAGKNSFQPSSNENNEEMYDIRQPPLITLEYSHEFVDLDVDEVTEESIKKSGYNSKDRSKNLEKTVAESQITGEVIFDSLREINDTLNDIKTKDKNKKLDNLKNTPLDEINDKLVINANLINTMKSISIDNSLNPELSTIQNSLDSFLITPAESMECISKSSPQKSNPKNISSPNISKTNESLPEMSEHDKSEKQIHTSCQEEETKNKKSEKTHIISAHNKRKMKKESSKTPLDFDPRKPPPLINQSFTTNEEILQPPPAFDPRRNLSTIVPEFDPQMPPPILGNQTDTIKSFNAHLPPIPSIIPSAPATGAPINMPSTLAGYGRPGYNPIVPYVPAVPMSYSQVIAPVEYPLTQMAQPLLPPSTVNNSLSVERVTNKSETNGDPNLSVDDVLGEMKEAMEFAKQCMIMGEDEDVIDFPTLPNLPPLPDFGEHSKDKPTTKQKKTKKSKQETCYGPHPKPSSEKIQEASRELTLASIRLPEEKSKLSLEKKSKTSEVKSKTADEKNISVEETSKLIEEKNTFLEEKIKCYDEENPGDDLGRRKVMFNLSAKFKKLNKTEEWMNEAMEEEDKQKNKRLKIISSPTVAIAVVAPTTMTSTVISEQNNYTSQEETSSELVKVSTSSENNHQKNRDLTQTRNKNKEEKRESKKHSDKNDTHEDIQRKTRRSSRAQLTSGLKSEKNDSNNEFIAEKINEAKTYTHKLSGKKITPALTESSWKNRVITRFLKMSKNDIQNMINNSSLRKFDIAMQHLVKEKKSSLSLEMRLNEHEKTKNSSNYNNEDFMSQLQAILDPAATVDITNLPTTFLHQLSEVLHLDPLPTDIEDSSDKSESQISLNQDSSSLEIDKPVFIDSSQYLETSTPGTSTYDMSKPRKIDKQSIDMSKHTSTIDTSTYSRTRNKRNQVDTSVQRSASSSTIAPIHSVSTIDNLNMDDLDDIFVAGIRAKTKSTSQSSNNSSITTNERIATAMPVKKIETAHTENDQIPTEELDEIFSAVLAKTKTFSIKNTASTSMETLEREQSHIPHRQLHGNTSVISSWKRKGIDDPDNFRNLTKEEYEARYGDPSHTSNDDENRTITYKTQKVMLNGREITTYSTHSNKNYSSYTPPDVQNINNPTESDNDSVSGLESDSSSSSSSVSDEESLDVSKVLRFIKEREKIAKKKSLNEKIRDEVSAEIEKKRREKNAKHRSHKSRSKRKERKKKERERKGKKKKPKKKCKRRQHHSPLSNISENENEERPLWLLREDEIKKEPTEEVLKEEGEEENESEHLITHSKITLTAQSSKVTSEIKKNIGHNVSTTAIQTSTVVPHQQSSIMNLTPIVTHSVVSNIKTSPASPSTTFPLRTNMSCSSSTRSSQSPLPHTKTKAQLKQMPEVLTKTKIDKPTSIETRLLPEKESITNQICVEKTNLVIEESSTIIPITTTITTTTATTMTEMTTATALSTMTTSLITSGPRKLDIKQYQERAHRRKLQEQEKGRAIAENPSVLTQDLLKLPPMIKSTESENRSTLITSSEPSKLAANIPMSVTNTSEVKEVEKTDQKIPSKTAHICKTEEKPTTETFKTSNIPVRTKLIRTSTSTSALKNLNSKNVEESKFANIKSEGSKEMKLKEKLKRKPIKPVITDITILKNNTQNKKLKISPTSSTSVKTSSVNEEIIKTSETSNSAATSVPLLSPASSKTKTLDEKKVFINIEIDQQNKLEQKTSELEKEKEVKINSLNTSQTNVAEVSCEVSKEVASEDISTSQQKINAYNKSAQKFSHYFTSSKQIKSDGFPDTVTFEIMETKKQNISTEKSNQKLTPLLTKVNEDCTKTIHENTIDLVHDLKELSNPAVNKEMKEEMNEPRVCSEVQPISINLQLEENSDHGDKLLLVSNHESNIKNIQSIKEKPLESQEHSIKEIPLTNMPINTLENIEIQSITNEEENDEIKEEKELQLPEKEVNLSISHLQDLEKLSSTISCNSEDHMSENISESSTLVLSDEIKIINTFERITTDELTDISDAEFTNDKSFSGNLLPEINSLSESPNKDQKELTLKETELLSKSVENNEILTSENNDWNVASTRTDDEVDITPEEIIDQPSHEQDLESSLLRVQTLNTYESEDIEVSFPSKSVVLHDKVLAADNVRNSFLDDPIAFSNTKSPTPETIEFGILGDADIVGSIYNNQLDETSAIDSIEDVPTDEPFGEDEGVNTLALSALENSCLPPETDDSFILSQNSSEQIKDTDFPDKELMKEIEGTSPERLPSPILQLTSRLSDDNDNNDVDNDNINNDDSIENVTKITITVSTTEGVINSKNIYPESTAPTEHRTEPTSDILENNSLTVDTDIDKDIELKSLNGKSPEKISEQDKIEESLEEILSGNPSKYVQMSPTIEENILNIVDNGQTESNINCEPISGSTENPPIIPEILTSSIQSQLESQNTKKQENDSLRKNSRSKSRTPTRDQKKNKKRHHHRKKSKLSVEKIEEALTANIIKPVLVTKDSVMMRMQEIDLTIQKLMDEKMALYRMLKDDKWPSVQTEEHPILTESKTPKLKTHLSTSLTDKFIIKSPRVVVSRLADSDMKKASTSTIVELPQSKPEYSSTPKHEGLLLNKFSKAEVKKTKLFRSNDYAISKLSKKRKYKEDKDHSRSKDLKKDGSPEAKRQMHSEESPHKHKKSPIFSKNIGEPSRKPFKLAQLLKTFKPKTPIEKRRSTSPKEPHRIQKSLSTSVEKHINVNKEFTKLSKNNDLNSSEEETNRLTISSEKNKSSVSNDKNSENDERLETSKKSNKEHHNISEGNPHLIYSDDSTWDHSDRFHEKTERSTGLLLLEESMKREKAAKKSKYIGSKKKISNSNTKEDSASSDFDDTIPLAYAITKKKLKKKHLMINKKSNKNNTTDETSRIDHTEEIIDAVATNRIHDLYDNSMIKDSDQETFKKESSKKVLKTVEELDNTNVEESREISDKIEERTQVTKAKIIEENTEIDNIKQNQLDTEMSKEDNFRSKTPDFVEPLQITEKSANESIPDEAEWTTLDSVGFIDEKDDGIEDISDDRLEIHTSYEEENSNITSDDILQKIPEETPAPETLPLATEEDKIDDTKSDSKINDNEKHRRMAEIQSTILQDWAESPSHSSRYDNDINPDMEKSRFDLNQIPTREISLMLNTCEKTNISTVEENNRNPNIDDISVNEGQTLFVDNDNSDEDSISSKTLEEPIESTTMKDKEKNDNEVEEKRKEKENIKNQDEEEKSKKRKSSLEREIERPKSTVKELEKHRHLSEEPVKSETAVEELKKSESSMEKTNNERSKSITKKMEISKSATKEVERPKSTVKEIERPRSTVKEIERPRSTVKEIEKPESETKEIEKSKSITKEMEIPKSAIKEIEEPESAINEYERPESATKEIERPKSATKEVERPRSTVKEIERPKSTVKEIERPRSKVREIEKLESETKEIERPESETKEMEIPKSAIKEIKKPESETKEIERPTSTIKEIERPKSTVKEIEKPESAIKEIERPKSTIKEIERPKSTVKEIERPESETKEIERPRSTVKDIERQKSKVKEIEVLKSSSKEIEPEKSIVKDSVTSKSTVQEAEKIAPKLKITDEEELSTAKDIERDKISKKKREKIKTKIKIIDEEESLTEKNIEDDEIPKKKREKVKSKPKVIDNEESPAEKDNENDEIFKKKREKINKNKNRSASRRSSRSSRQSDDSSRASRSRSRSTRARKSPNSRDTSPTEMDLKNRPTSGGSSSSSVNSRRKEEKAPNSKSIETIKIDGRSTRWKRKRKTLDDSDINLMRKCKVRLIEFQQIYREPSLYSKFLHSHGLSRINNWILQEITPRQETPQSELDRPSISDEDKNHSDDDSMELIQVEEADDLQAMETLDSLPDDSIQDSIDQNDNNSLISSEFAESPQEVDIAESDFDEYHDDEEPEVLESDIEILEKQSPAANTSSLIHSEDTESEEPRRTQYTVHKGPILDIKVFGDSFLAASEDGAIYRYSQRSNGILNIYKGHDAAVTCLYIHEVPGTAESGNTRWNLFSGSLDATLRCYDIINGSLERHISEIGSPIQCMDQAWGSIFIGTKSGHISRYDIKSGCLREDKLDFSDKPILALRASTEGPRKILIVASRNQPITIRDAQNGLFLRTISGQRNHTVYSLLMDRNLVYCGTSNTSIPVFDFISGEQVAQYTAGVGIVCMRLYKQLLFAGCYDGNIYVFDINDSKLICSIPGPGNMLLSLEIVNDEIIAGSKDRRLHAWRMPNQVRNIIADRT